MKKLLSLLLCCILMMSTLTVSLAENALSVTGKVTEIEKFGHALLNISIEDFNQMGFKLGDVVAVKAGSFEGDMPFLDGYYVDQGEYMLRAYPGQEFIAVCISYGKFAESAGVHIGDDVIITLKAPGAALDLQVMNALAYTDSREDYASDAVFANFRNVKMGQIGEGKLYRSASPVSNERHRAAISNRLAAEAGVRAVMNLADTDEEIRAYIAAEDFDSAYYAELYHDGRVIALGLPINYSSEEFAEGIVKGLTFLSGQETPYLVHCTEGKDRAGFAVMLLEALMGASKEEIIADYMTSYVNYYGIDPDADADKYNMITQKNVVNMLRMVCGLEKDAPLDGVDLAAGAEAYLLEHGMAAEVIQKLKNNLK